MFSLIAFLLRPSPWLPALTAACSKRIGVGFVLSWVLNLSLVPFYKSRWTARWVLPDGFVRWPPWGTMVRPRFRCEIPPSRSRRGPHGRTKASVFGGCIPSSRVNTVGFLTRRYGDPSVQQNGSIMCSLLRKYPLAGYESPARGRPCGCSFALGRGGSAPVSAVLNVFGWSFRSGARS